MTKFIDALQLDKDLSGRLKAKMPSCFKNPFEVNEYHINDGYLQAYRLQLVWSVQIWLDADRSRPTALEDAKKEAVRNLKREIYSEIYQKLAEIRFILNNGDVEEGLKQIQSLMLYLFE
jgi:hypothetical protein